MQGIVRKFIPAVMVMMLALIQPTAHAAGKCKGLNKSGCSANPACSWVDSYKTKTGKLVNAYCRGKPGKKAAADTQSSKADKSKKADKAQTQAKSGKAGSETKKQVKEKTKKKKQGAEDKKDKKSTN